MRTRTMLVWAVVMALTLVACGGQTDDPNSSVASMSDETGDSGGATDTTAPESEEEAQLAFAECMRGEDMPVPDDIDDVSLKINGAQVEDEPDFDTLSDSDSVTINGVEVDTGDFVAAIEACRDLMDDVVAENQSNPALTAEFQDQVLEFHQCMRDQGLYFPDPIFEENGDITLSIDENDPRLVDPESEEFKAAEEACGGPPQPPGEEEGTDNE